MYIFISGEIKNKRFIQNLPGRLQGLHKVALVDHVIRSKFTKPLLLSLDICGVSLVNSQYTSVLRRLDNKSVEYSQPFFMEIVPKSFSKLEFSFLDNDLKYVEGVKFSCTLWLIAN